ncbi:hypothetical protein JQS43_13870 [Natronosporangium hydrolyticum]|uniref:Uncharacterized protein n=1 Tax=Natronosporangium hydrolyticum TaxID=2811111 RepID=A0A895YE02_9ACTN|nr:streptophobe family protein [Natronosporangium hydrolyticum]QSB12776.1 hypothetical protein JQS43_13870 [Natronosporangium hydrolyticum]
MVNWRGGVARVGVDLAVGAVAALVAGSVMVVVAAAGLALLGADRYGAIGELTVGAVLLAVSGAAELSTTADGAPVTGQGMVRFRPLGVAVTGAVALGSVLAGAARWRSASLPRWTIRATAAVIVVAVVAGTVSATGVANTTVTINQVAPGEELLIDLGWPPLRTAVGAGLWAGATLVLWWLLSQRLPGPAGAVRLRAAVRPAVRALVVAAGAGTGLVVVGAAALAGADGAGAALLAAPTVVLALTTIGLGARWSISLDGPLGALIQARWPELGDEQPWGLSRLTTELGTVGWLLPVATAAVVLGTVGWLAARRRRGSASGPAARIGRVAVLRESARLAGALAVALPAATVLAHAGLQLAVAVFGSTVPMLVVDLRSGLWGVAAAGLVGGAAAGLIGQVLVELVRRARRSRLRILEADDGAGADERGADVRG